MSTRSLSSLLVQLGALDCTLSAAVLCQTAQKRSLRQPKPQPAKPRPVFARLQRLPERLFVALEMAQVRVCEHQDSSGGGPEGELFAVTLSAERSSSTGEAPVATSESCQAQPCSSSGGTHAVTVSLARRPALRGSVAASVLNAADAPEASLTHAQSLDRRPPGFPSGGAVDSCGVVGTAQRHGAAGPRNARDCGGPPEPLDTCAEPAEGAELLTQLRRAAAVPPEVSGAEGRAGRSSGESFAQAPATDTSSSAAHVLPAAHCAGAGAATLAADVSVSVVRAEVRVLDGALAKLSELRGGCAVFGALATAAAPHHVAAEVTVRRASADARAECLRAGLERLCNVLAAVQASGVGALAACGAAETRYACDAERPGLRRASSESNGGKPTAPLTWTLRVAATEGGAWRLRSLTLSCPDVGSQATGEAPTELIVKAESCSACATSGAGAAPHSDMSARPDGSTGSQADDPEPTPRASRHNQSCSSQTVLEYGSPEVRAPTVQEMLACQALGMCMRAQRMAAWLACRQVGRPR